MKNYYLISMWMLAILIVMQPSYANPNEYLFPNEKLGPIISTIEIDNLNYYIYSIEETQADNFLVINSDQILACEDNIKKSIFTHYTHLYMKENSQEIANHFKETYNILDDQSDSSTQQILNVFKMIDKICVKVPNFEIISICVKPTDDLKIMKWMDTVFIDWDVVLKNYEALGGKILYSIGKSDTTKYDKITELYVHMMSTDSFLKSTTKVTGISFPSKKIAEPETIANNVMTKTSSKCIDLNERLIKLSKEEDNGIDIAKIEINNIKNSISQIIRLNENADSLKTKLNTFRQEVNSINPNDNLHKSDIIKLDSLNSELITFKNEVETQYPISFERYNNKSGFGRLIAYIVGGIKSMFY